MHFRALFLILCTFSGSGFGGVLFTAQMSRSRGVSTYKTWSEGKNFKAVVETSNDSGLSTGNFVISRDGGATWIAASARWKRYLELSPEELQERIGTRPKVLGDRLQSLILQKVGEQDGGPIAGYATRRHTVRVSVVMRTRRFWRDVITRMVVTENVWMAESVPSQCPELGLVMQESTGALEVDRALAIKDIKGFPMKRVVEVVVDGERVASNSVEVKALTQMPVADSVFAVPANYKKH